MNAFVEKLQYVLETRKKKADQRGFTLLELLVVVAILAAIAGTATIALQDTDARASAAAHVAMMDELNKGVRTFRVLQKNVLPDQLDSLCYSVAGTPAASDALLLPNDSSTVNGDIFAVEGGDISAGQLLAGAGTVMEEIGMTELRYISGANALDTPEGVAANGCDPTNGVLQATVADRGNNVVPGNIFNSAAGNGCGYGAAPSDTAQVAYWSGAIERIIGPGPWGDAAYAPATDGAGAVSSTGTTVPDGTEVPILLAVGFGPSSNLFNAQLLGGMTSVPSYRHVTADQYNRFIGLFQVGSATMGATTAGAWDAPVVTDQIAFVGVVDGAGDTKEEELGEWDGSRNTI